MGKMSNLPRVGEPEALTEFLVAHKDELLPERFIDFVLAHLDRGLAFKSQFELQNTVGGVLTAARSKAQVRECASHVQKALDGEALSGDQRGYYESLRTGFSNMLTQSKIPD